MIRNLVLNACEAVPSVSGRVEVRSSGLENCVEISVPDNGPGIPAHVRHAVFQPFVSCGKEEGTGLGLAIVRNILQSHGGDIFLDATGEKGTHFRLVLPFIGPQGNESLAPNDTPARHAPHQIFQKTLDRQGIVAFGPESTVGSQPNRKGDDHGK